MVQLSDEHGGHAIQGRATLLVDRCQRNQRIKTLHQNLGATVCKAVHGCQNHAKAVEQGYAYAELVILSEFHVLTCQETVICYVVMGKHDSLGESCRTRCILHVYDVMACNSLAQTLELIILSILTQKQYLSGVIHTTELLLTYINHVLELGETLALQMAALTLAQLRQHGVGHIHVVALPCAVGKAEGVHIGVLNQILQLVLLVVGVYSDADSTDLGTCIKERKPVRHVLSPQAHVAAPCYTYCYKAACHVIDPLVELFPGKTQVAVRIYYILFVGSLLSPMLKPVSECSFR